jgi:hypothetical protein
MCNSIRVAFEAVLVFHHLDHESMRLGPIGEACEVPAVETHEITPNQKAWTVTHTDKWTHGDSGQLMKCNTNNAHQLLSTRGPHSHRERAKARGHRHSKKRPFSGVCNEFCESRYRNLESVRSRVNSAGCVTAPPKTHERNSRALMANSKAARPTLWTKNKKKRPDDQQGASVRPTHHNTHLRHHGGPLWRKKSGTAFGTPKTRSGGSFLLFWSPRNRVREPQMKSRVFAYLVNATSCARLRGPRPLNKSCRI